MSEAFGNLFNRKPPQKGGPIAPEPASTASPFQKTASERKPAYSKVFRWHLADGHTQAPASVEVAGTFSHWEKVPLFHDSAVGAWHVTLHHVQAHRTHHYMLLVDGKPTYDKTCDGLAIPQGPVEEGFAVQTHKGPRVLMLFAQTK